MTSISSSECVYADCFTNLQGYNLGPNSPFYTTLGHPLVYWAQVPQSKFYSKRSKPNYFVKAFRWYTRERYPQRLDELSNRSGQAEFAEWLDEKYGQFLEDKRHSCSRICSSLDTNKSITRVPCEPCKNILAEAKSWRKKRCPFANYKENGSTSEKAHQSLEIILEPKNLSRPVSECHHTQSLSNKSHVITATFSDAQASKRKVEVLYSSDKITSQKLKCENCKEFNTLDGEKEYSTEIKSLYYIKTKDSNSPHSKQAFKNTPVPSQAKKSDSSIKIRYHKNANAQNSEEKTTSKYRRRRDRKKAKKNINIRNKKTSRAVNCECLDENIKHSILNNIINTQVENESQDVNGKCQEEKILRKDARTQYNSNNNACVKCCITKRNTAAVDEKYEISPKTSKVACDTCCLKTSTPTELLQAKPTLDLPVVTAQPMKTTHIPPETTCHIEAQTSDHPICLEKIPGAPYFIKLIGTKQCITQQVIKQPK